jgi:Glycosyltransferases involved in cell wall biogenesis
MKILTINIAAYNAERYISKCLDSLIKCNDLDLLDIAVVNDGSTDRTSELAHQYEKNYPNSIRVIDKEDNGYGSTINIGIKTAKGKYFKTLDSDDYFNTDVFNEFVNNLKQCECDLVLNDYVIRNPDYNVIESKRCLKDSELYNHVLNFENNLSKTNITMHCITYKTSILKKMIEKIDENCFYVDVEYNTYPLKYVNNFVSFCLPVYSYIVGYSNQSVSTKSFIKNRKQHEKVVYSLVNYYEQNKDTMNTQLREITKYIVSSLAITQYWIYFVCNPSAEIKAEIINFDCCLKHNSLEIYSDMIKYGNGQKRAKIIPILRVISFHGYVLLFKIIHKFNVISIT